MYINKITQNYLSDQNKKDLSQYIRSVPYGSIAFIDKVNCGNGTTTYLLEGLQEYKTPGQTTHSLVTVPTRATVASKSGRYPCQMGEGFLANRSKKIWDFEVLRDDITICTLSLLTSSRNKSNILGYFKKISKYFGDIIIFVDEVHVRFQKASPEIQKLIELLEETGVKWKVIGVSATIPEYVHKQFGEMVYTVQTEKVRLNYAKAFDKNLDALRVTGAYNIVYSINAEMLRECMYYLCGEKIANELRIIGNGKRINIEELAKIHHSEGWIGLTSSVIAGTDLFLAEEGRLINLVIDASSSKTSVEDIVQIPARFRAANKMSVTVIPRHHKLGSGDVLSSVCEVPRLKDTRELFDLPHHNHCGAPYPVKGSGKKLTIQDVLSFDFSDDSIVIPTSYKYLPIRLLARNPEHLSKINEKTTINQIIEMCLFGPQLEIWNEYQAMKPKLQKGDKSGWLAGIAATWSKWHEDTNREPVDIETIRKYMKAMNKYMMYTALGCVEDAKSLEKASPYTRERIYTPWCAIARPIRKSAFSAARKYLIESDFSNLHPRILLFLLGCPIDPSIDIYKWADPSDRNAGKLKIIKIINQLHFGKDKTSQERYEWISKKIPLTAPIDNDNIVCVNNIIKYLRKGAAEVDGFYAANLYAQIERRCVDAIIAAIGNGYLRIHDGVDFLTFDPYTGLPRKFVAPENNMLTMLWKVNPDDLDTPSVDLPLTFQDHSGDGIVEDGDLEAIRLPRSVGIYWLEELGGVEDNDSLGRHRAIGEWKIQIPNYVSYIKEMVEGVKKAVKEGRIAKGHAIPFDWCEPKHEAVLKYLKDHEGVSVYSKGTNRYMTHPDWPEKAHKAHKAHEHKAKSDILEKVLRSLKEEPNLSERARAEKLGIGRKQLSNYLGKALEIRLNAAMDETLKGL